MQFRVERLQIIRLLAKAKTIAAFSYKKNVGQPFVYPQNDLSYCANFLRMTFAVPAEPCSPVHLDLWERYLEPAGAAPGRSTS